MPYIILTANGEELDRRDLTGPLTVGRSPECDVCIHDILMSRVHCRIEQSKGRWKVIDVGSKNGTHFNWKRITEHMLFDGDTLRLGRTHLKFYSAAFVAGTAKARKGKMVRPADPHEALTGTVSDFVLAETDGDDTEFDGAPSPQNRASSAKVSQSEATISSVLEELSSSWDSIVATAVKPGSRMRVMPRPIPTGASPKPLRKRVEVDLSLHATPQHLPFLEVIPQPKPKARRTPVLPYVAAGVGIVLATLVVLFSGWAMMTH